MEVEGQLKNDHPLKLKYVRVVRLVLCCVGAWPGPAFGEKSFRTYISCTLALITVYIIGGEFYYIKVYGGILPFFDLGDLFMTTAITILTLVRHIIPMTPIYFRVSKLFLTELHLGHFKHKGEHYQKTYDRINSISSGFTWFMVLEVGLASVFFNITPFYNNLVNGVYAHGINKSSDYRVQFSVYYLSPWWDPLDHFMFTTTTNAYFSYVCAITVCGVDLYMYLMAFTIMGHTQCLIQDLRNMPRPKKTISVEAAFDKTGLKETVYCEMFDAQENEAMRHQIIACVKHHRLIIRFAEEVSSTFGPMLALTYAYHLISCALLLLQLSEGSRAAFIRYGPLTVTIFFQLIMMSVTFELLTSKTELLMEEGYYIPWECMNTSNRKLVWIFINRIQIPVRVTALGMVEVGVMAMAGILKTTFSYFALLRSMQ